MMKKESSMRNIFLRNLLLGMLLPFVLILFVIAVLTFKDVQKDKADMIASNVNAVV